MRPQAPSGAPVVHEERRLKALSGPCSGPLEVGKGGVEPADPRSCGPANSVAAALSPGNADLQRPLFPTVALGCSARVHHHGAPMILIPFIIWCSHTRARRSSSIDRRVNGACRPHTPPAGSVKMIEAGVSGPGATGIDGHLPRAGWHTQAAGDTHGPGRDRGGPGRSPNHRSRRGGGQERVEVTFASEDGGARLVLRHHDLPSDEQRQ